MGQAKQRGTFEERQQKAILEKIMTDKEKPLVPIISRGKSRSALIYALGLAVATCPEFDIIEPIDATLPHL